MGDESLGVSVALTYVRFYSSDQSKIKFYNTHYREHNIISVKITFVVNLFIFNYMYFKISYYLVLKKLYIDNLVGIYIILLWLLYKCTYI